MAKLFWSRLLFLLISIIFLMRESQTFARTVLIEETVTYIRASTKALGSQLSPRAFLYFDELDKLNPHISLKPVQQTALINALFAENFHRLNSTHTKTHRENFTPELKESLRDLWEAMTGQTWPRYEKDIFQGKKLIQSEGTPYEMHHILKVCSKGPHEWWNMFPVTFKQHERIHSKTSFCEILHAGPIGTDLSELFLDTGSYELVRLDGIWQEIRLSKKKRPKKKTLRIP